MIDDLFPEFKQVTKMIHVSTSKTTRIRAERIGVICILVLLLFCLQASAHPFGGVYQKTYIYPMGPFILVGYHTHIGRDILVTLNADTDRDHKLSDTEEHQLSERLSTTLLPNLEAFIDNTLVPLVEMEKELSLENPADLLAGVNLVLTLKIALPQKAEEPFVLQFHDHNFLAGEMDRLNYYHSVMGTSSGSRLLEDGRVLEIRWGTPAPEDARDVTPKNSHTHDLSKPSSETDILSEYFTREQTGPGIYLAAILGAFVLGAAHAVSPGHGKAILAAYLVGSQGQISHAFLLGLIVTFTHVAMVIVLGIVALMLSDYFLPQDLYPWLDGISGAIIFLIGYWMLARRFFQQAPHSHGHHHEHDHNHHHDHKAADADDISLKGLLSMGIAGGMVPCPSALVVLLVSLSFQRVAEGLGLIFFFSLGLAAVLILIGVLTVTASRFAGSFSANRAWLHRLPAFSAGCIMIFGIAVIFNSFLSAGIIQLKW